MLKKTHKTLVYILSPFNAFQKGFFFFKYKSGTYLELGIHCSFPRKARMLPQIFLRVKKEHNYKELMHRQELGFFLLFQLIIFENYLEKLIFALHVL